MRFIDADAFAAKYPNCRDLQQKLEKEPTYTMPVFHAKWKGFFRQQFLGVDDYGEPKYRDGKIYHCSECNHRSIIKHNYCPNCGAKMDGEA